MRHRDYENNIGKKSMRNPNKNMKYKKNNITRMIK
jgi:hypothetical protein